MSESYSEQLSRVRLMATDREGQWDLSDNDCAALSAVLSRLEFLENRDMVCSYCGKGSTPGATHEQKCQEVKEHVLLCEKRPEKQLLEKMGAFVKLAFEVTDHLETKQDMDRVREMAKAALQIGETK